jgi:ATP-dependent RNA helicase DDX18/HAS1
VRHIDLVAHPWDFVQVIMKDVQTVVLDEVDVLFLDDSFDLSTLGATTPATAQFLFVTATLPVPVADQVS